jgi:ABC-2 type transport system permease protein
MTAGLLSPYRAVLGARFRMLLQYRAAALGGLITQSLFGFLLIMIYEAFYRSSTAEVQPMPFAHVASYVWLGQALLMMLPWSVDVEMRNLMRSGGVVYELCRPVDLYAWWFARSLAQRTAPVLLRAAPMVVLAAIVLPALGLDEWRLAPPASLAAGIGFLLALACGLGVACAMSVVLYVAMLWIAVADGVVAMVSTVVGLLSGLLIPLPLFPDWARPVLRWLPFAGLLDQPARAYSGEIVGGELAAALACQLGWLVALVAFGRWLLGRGLRRVVVQGG